MKTALVLAMNERQLDLARTIAEAIAGEVRVLASRADEHTATFDNVVAELRASFRAGHPIVAIMAAGIVIRALADDIADKATEPPVIAVSDDGRSVVPLLGGHRGANAMAKRIAAACNGHAAITTAGDVAIGIALDDPPEGYTLVDGDAKAVMAALVAGEPVSVDPELGWASTLAGTEPNAALRLRLNDRTDAVAAMGELIYRAKRYVIGVGCERGVPAGELTELVQKVLSDHSLSAKSIALVASLDLKSDEQAVHALAASLRCPARFLSASELKREEPRLATPSEIVRAEVGVAGVAEAAALAAAGSNGELAVTKRKSGRCTVAIAKSPVVIDAGAVGRARGTLSLVGLGPGSPDLRSPKAERAIREADHVVGYSLYLDLCEDIRRGERHDFPLGGEEDRVREAIRLAAGGTRVALVCSGDPGIYAMAALAYEVLERGGCTDAERRVGVQVIPGISALQGAAALVGAPLGHDFCAISLSDLLTPWPVIERRIEAAAIGDFVIAFYNPVSKRRRTQLTAARRILREHRRDDVPVVLVANIARAAEKTTVTTLADLDVDQVDMLTTVIVGSTHTRAFARGDGSVCVYTPRGYSAKDGTGIEQGGTAVARAKEGA